MNFMGMKVSQETLVYCFIAFLVGYFFTSLWGSVCRCKQVEGYAVEHPNGKLGCVDNVYYGGACLGKWTQAPDAFKCWDHIHGHVDGGDEVLSAISKKHPLSGNADEQIAHWNASCHSDRMDDDSQLMKMGAKEQLGFLGDLDKDFGGNLKARGACKLAVKQKDKFLDEMGSMTPEQIKKKGELVKKALGDCVNPESLVRYSDEFQDALASDDIFTGSEGYTDYSAF